MSRKRNWLYSSRNWINTNESTASSANGVDNMEFRLTSESMELLIESIVDAVEFTDDRDMQFKLVKTILEDNGIVEIKEWKIMEEIVKILMERDGNTREEALSIIEDIKEMMEECDYDPEECENIFETELGLEPDYIPRFLFR